MVAQLTHQAPRGSKDRVSPPGSNSKQVRHFLSRNRSGNVEYGVNDGYVDLSSLADTANNNIIFSECSSFIGTTYQHNFEFIVYNKGWT